MRIYRRISGGLSSDGINIDAGDAVSQTVAALLLLPSCLALSAGIMLMLMNLIRDDKTGKKQERK